MDIRLTFVVNICGYSGKSSNILQMSAAKIKRISFLTSGKQTANIKIECGKVPIAARIAIEKTGSIFIPK